MFDVITLAGSLLDSCAYLVSCDGISLLVEPAVTPAQLGSGNTAVNMIAATHGHIDHICEADTLRSFTGAPLFIHEQEAGCLADPARNLSSYLMESRSFNPADNLMTDGQIINLAQAYDLKVIHTPGHSPGSVCLLLLEAKKPAALFTGDTLFAGTVGRTDLPGGNPRELAASLEKLASLNLPDIPVYPGHGPETSWAYELNTNFYLKRSIS